MKHTHLEIESLRFFVLRACSASLSSDDARFVDLRLGDFDRRSMLASIWELMGNGLRPPRFSWPSVKATSSSLGDLARSLPLFWEDKRGDKLGKVDPRATGFVFSGEGRAIGLGVWTNVAERGILVFLVLLVDASPLRASSETFSFVRNGMGNSCGSRRNGEGSGRADFLTVRLSSALTDRSGVLLLSGKPCFCAARGGVDSELLPRLRTVMTTRGFGRGFGGARGVSLAVGEGNLEVEGSLASGSRRAVVRVVLGLP